MVISLREITADTVRSITRLAVTEPQNKFVAPNAVSLSEALFSPEAWYRGIYSDESPVGFVMLYDETQRSPLPQKPQIAIWRFMIDAQHQSRGFGRDALRLVIEHVRNKNATATLLVSYVPGDGDPETFYRQAGFEPTGDVDDGEIVLSLML